MNGESALQLLLIDNDPIFRMGLKFSCEQFSDIEILGEAEVGAEAIKVIENLITQEKKFVIILDIDTQNLSAQTTQDFSISGIEFCQQLKTSYPQLPILLLTSLQESALLVLMQELGVNGYCPKGISISELVTIIRKVANGEYYWENSSLDVPENYGKVTTSNLKVQAANFFKTLRYNVCKSGLKQIDLSLAKINSQLDESVKNLDRKNLTSVLFNVAINSGQRRELLTARWIINQLLPSSFNPLVPIKKSEVISPTPTEEINIKTALFEVTIAKLNSNLINLSRLPMETDILRTTKKQELICIALCKFEDILDELRITPILREEIPQKRNDIVSKLWEVTTQVFFSKYYQVEISSRTMTLNSFAEKIRVEVIPVLLNDVENVHNFILNKIPLVEELIAYLLFEVPLVVDNKSCAVGTPEAMQFSEALLQNLLISIANAVMYPLLNNFADVEEIKEDFYSRQLLSTRDIEKFRNSLSWRYRIEEYVGEPKAIFESNFSLFVLNETGIKKMAIYSPRRHELAKLSGIPLTVTLLLETRDAIAPGVRATVSFIGSGIVYLLTQVVGRGIGLIGRGIFQGLGNSFQDTKLGRNNNREETGRNN
ncbi:MAG: DUF3685 domain-containing protein [Okeania sp. SIO2G4]|uniref:DUF3685 domain-containing protein n=1 Tax=unclassified Okeania TaxID=2634635 RepID=UPI0013B983D5|nr:MULTISPECIES: DUF3685 domain-containing protein [unclassified Okeania]NEP41794.1 DUF3685 domain-containing protein [Okeania sp. SIO2H7]NEP73474.1 DUF3685 domain-containing protein [Okeania sp. SIO2G5]NEP94192.1 DUF3685 domain-containing protein [Okeania sp. SIO2F5]NEQ92146.1 DUF3685 domain-containing protein [Okeania sp. SIO2G4]